MNHEDLRLLVDFNYWARDRMLEAVETLTPEQYARDPGNSFKSVRDTLVHMYSAETTSGVISSEERTRKTTSGVISAEERTRK